MRIDEKRTRYRKSAIEQRFFPPRRQERVFLVRPRAISTDPCSVTEKMSSETCSVWSRAVDVILT